MPEILRMFGMRFFFYSREHEPIHVHVKSAVLEENKELAIEKWNEYFGGCVKNEDF